MYINPFVAKLLVEERMEDAICLEEQARLIQEVVEMAAAGGFRT